MDSLPENLKNLLIKIHILLHFIKIIVYQQIYHLTRYFLNGNFPLLIGTSVDLQYRSEHKLISGNGARGDEIFTDETGKRVLEEW